MVEAGDPVPVLVLSEMTVACNGVHSVARLTRGAVGSLQICVFKSMGAIGSVKMLRNQWSLWGDKSVVIFAMVQTSSKATSKMMMMQIELKSF